MKKDIEQYELIERYLKNELSDGELREVNDRIRSDAKFAHEVKQHEILMSFVTEGSLLEIRNSIENIHLNFRESFFSRIFKNRIFLYSLTTLIFIAFIVVTFNIKNDSNQSATVTPPAKSEIKPVTTEEPAPEEEKIKKDVVGIAVNEGNRSQETAIDKETKIQCSDNANKVETNQTKPDNITLTAKEDKIVTLPENNTKKETEGNIISENIDCEQYHIIADVKTEPSCVRAATGSILVNGNTINGGTPPYKVSIDNKKTFVSEFAFNQLKSGSYILWIADKNNCFEKIGAFWIDTRDCENETNDYVFAPEKQERWKIPQVESGFEIEIFNQQGILIYKSLVNEYSEEYWDGSSNSGQPQPMGIYSFVIKRKDQSDISGNVTIVK